MNAAHADVHPRCNTLLLHTGHARLLGPPVAAWGQAMAAACPP
jgi:hypothetical protein